MFTLLELYNHIKKSQSVPDEKDISLKLYCEYFEKYIDKCIYTVDLNNGDSFQIKISAKSIPHIIDLHAFYDKSTKILALKYPDSFTGVKGYKNMKKSVIDIDVLKKAKYGNQWKDKTIKNRVLGFPFIRNAILKGTWYKFDINKYEGKTKVDSEYIAVWKVKNIFFNFCFKKSNDSYYCLTDIIAYNSNSRVKNQKKLNVERVSEIKNGKLNEVVCHEPHVRNILNDKNRVVCGNVCSKVHDEIYKNYRSFNSILINEDIYQISCLEIDVIFKRYKSSIKPIN